MSERDVRRRLQHMEAPGEREAGSRVWEVVRAAHAEREPVPWTSRRARPLLAAAAALAVVGAAATSPGRAVLGDVREAIGVERSAPALFSLPAPGRLLVQSPAGIWIVQRDGSKRLLAGYREASWSPFGKFVVVTRENELVALEPDGDVHWTLARRDVRFARWGGTATDTRVAYLSGRELRVIAGDGKGDHLLARAVAPVAPAWRPGRRHVLAYVAADGTVHVVDADTGAERARWREGRPEHLLWSPDGAWLSARGDGLISVFTAGGFRVTGISTRSLSAGNPFVAAAFEPRGRRLAVASWDPAANRSVVEILFGARERTVFSGAGRFTGLSWSPDGRWLLVAWKDADQWVFIRSARVRKIRAVSGITAQFGGGSFPVVAGWCCP